MAQDKSAHAALCLQLRAAGWVFQTEHAFAECIGRGWKWDIAFPERMVAIEVDGGIWCEGAHGHPTTIMRNMEKRNWAARLGWRVLSFSTKEAKNGQALNFTEAVLLKIIGLTPAEELYATTKRSRRAPAVRRAR